MRPLIFDSHLDLAWNAMSWKRDLRTDLASLNAAETDLPEKGRGNATITLAEMRKGRIGVCLGTLMGRVPYGEEQVHGGSLDFPTHEGVYGFTHGQLGYYHALQELGEVRLIETQTELVDHVNQWLSNDDATKLPIGLIVAMEGCDGIMQPKQAEKWFRLGLRVASLVHYGTSAYAVGTGEDGPLSTKGRELLAEFERLGIILDVTHLSDTSFFEAIDCFGGPVLASHQNCRALVDGQRQFADEQVQRVIARDGILGVAMDAWMLSPGWIRGETTREVVGMDAIADQIDHICQLAGNRKHVAIGSDLDGGFGTEQAPTGLDSIADLQKIAGLLSQRGYSDDDIDAVFYRNWFEFFQRHLPV